MMGGALSSDSDLLHGRANANSKGIEEVDTGRQLRFRSTVELLTFLAEVGEARRDRDSQKSADANAGTSSFRKETKS